MPIRGEGVGAPAVTRMLPEDRRRGNQIGTADLRRERTAGPRGEGATIPCSHSASHQKGIQMRIYVHPSALAPLATGTGVPTSL